MELDPITASSHWVVYIEIGMSEFTLGGWGSLIHFGEGKIGGRIVKC